MKVLAISIRGAEFMYSPKTAHKVSAASAQKIADALNAAGYMLKDNPRGVWYIHDVDKYDTAFDYAAYQSFSVYKGTIRRRYC